MGTSKPPDAGVKPEQALRGRPGPQGPKPCDDEALQALATEFRGWATFGPCANARSVPKMPGSGGQQADQHVDQITAVG